MCRHSLLVWIWNPGGQLFWQAGPLQLFLTLPFMLWLVISFAAELLWLETLSGECTDSMASTVNFSVLFLFGNALGLWVIGVSVLLATRFIQRRDFLRSLFGLGQMVITAYLTWLAFTFLLTALVTRHEAVTLRRLFGVAAGLFGLLVCYLQMLIVAVEVETGRQLLRKSART